MRISNLVKVNVASDELDLLDRQLADVDDKDVELNITLDGQRLDPAAVDRVRPVLRQWLEEQIAEREKELEALGVSLED